MAFVGKWGLELFLSDREIFGSVSEFIVAQDETDFTMTIL